MKLIRRVLPFLALSFLQFSISFGQIFERLEIDFYVDGQKLPNALAGGLDAAQLSMVDLNNDGVEDLYIFDRVGDKQLAFLHDGTPGSAQYTFAPEYLENFPDLDGTMFHDHRITECNLTVCSHCYSCSPPNCNDCRRFDRCRLQPVGTGSSWCQGRVVRAIILTWDGHDCIPPSNFRCRRGHIFGWSTDSGGPAIPGWP